VAGLVVLLVLAWTVRQWQVKTLSSAALNTVQTQSSTMAQVSSSIESASSAIPEAALARGSIC
jgi:hypothetical protein